jgi:hypothetical protein
VLSFLFFAGQLARAATPSFGQPVTNGFVNTYNLWEASGLIASRQNPGVLWSHNDSGYPGTIMALSTNGTFLGQWSMLNLPYGGDFEDIAIGPGPNPQYHYIYLGDIGDNFSTRSSIHVYRFPEPSAYDFQGSANVYDYVPEWQDIELIYPDGPHNAEAMLVDPITGDLFIFTKLTNSADLYRVTRDEMTHPWPATLTYMRSISFQKISAADISADGGLIAVRRGTKGSLWTRGANDTVDFALAKSSSSININTNEPNGEAIAFEANGLGYFTISEGSFQPISFYPRTSQLPAQPRVFVPRGTNWLYDDFADPFGANWFATNFDDSAYNSGVAPFGYGGSAATTVEYGFPDGKFVTTYFRTRFNVASLSGLTNLALRVCFNDGIAAYLNGVEILRRNLATNADNDTLAFTSTETYRSTWQSFRIDPARLHTGTNTLAVEVHRANYDGAYLNFDAQLVEAPVDVPPQIVGAPTFENGKTVLNIAGWKNSVVSVIKSTNGVNWSSAGTVTLTNGVGTFQENVSALKFYRVGQ